MEKELKDINDLVIFLAFTGMKPMLRDEIWQCYGYKKRPVKGNIWNRMFPKMFELENFISREVLMMGLIDVLNGVKKSEVPDDKKLLIVLGVVDQFLSVTKHRVPSDVFMQDLFSAYEAYLKSHKTNLHEPVIMKAKDALDKKDFAKFMVGTIQMLAVEHNSDFLLNSDYIKNVVEKSSPQNKLHISMPDELYKKYVPLLDKRILNS